VGYAMILHLLPERFSLKRQGILGVPLKTVSMGYLQEKHTGEFV
jgi:hypothetical protein